MESNFALMSLVGSENFYHGISKKEFQLTRTAVEFLQHSGVKTPSLKQMEKADAILVLGEDLTNTAPMIALAIRQAARNVPDEEAKKKGIPLWNDAPVRELAQDKRSPLFVLTPIAGSLDEIAELVFRGSPAELADLGFAVANGIDNSAPVSGSAMDEIIRVADKIAFSLKNAKHPLIVSGISCGDEMSLKAALNIASALKAVNSDVMISLVLPECNSMGLSLLAGKSMEDSELLNAGRQVDTLIVLENDLYRRAGEDLVNKLFERSKKVIVIDHLVNRTTSEADILLPAATFAGTEGTMVNNEGRAQRFYRVTGNVTRVKGSRDWILELMKFRNKDRAVSWNCLEDIVESMADELQIFSKLKNYSPDADFRMLNSKIPRQTQRFSGRTAMNANIVSEPKLSQDPESPLAFSMEGIPEDPPSSLIPYYWTPGWNSVQATFNYLTEPDSSLKGGDPGIRLIEPADAYRKLYFQREQPGQEAGKDEWLIIPVYRIFGSEELSSVGSSIKEVICDPFVLMNQEDADLFSLKDGDPVQLEVFKIRLTLKVKIENSLRHGLAGLSVNFPGMPYVGLPDIGKFHKV